MEKTHLSRPKTVAVVGTGMAGLATAHLLHQDPQKRYQVTLIEKVGPFFDFMLTKSICYAVPRGSSRY